MLLANILAIDTIQVQIWEVSQQFPILQHEVKLGSAEQNFERKIGEIMWEEIKCKNCWQILWTLTPSRLNLEGCSTNCQWNNCGFLASDWQVMGFGEAGIPLHAVVVNLEAHVKMRKGGEHQKSTCSIVVVIHWDGAECADVLYGIGLTQVYAGRDLTARGILRGNNCARFSGTICFHWCLNWQCRDLME